MNTKKPKALNIRTFGSTDIQYNDKSIFLEKQLASKTIALLRYFIINRETSCKTEQIIEDLWPDNEYIDEKKVLQTYVHRLRNMFARENSYKMDFTEQINILHKGGGYQLNVSGDVSIDADDFLSMINAVLKYETHEDLMKAVQSLQELYSGHFMNDGAHNHTVIKQQNYYRREYCSIMAIILSKLSELEAYSDIINICESFFLIDDMNESINCMFMKALVKLGQVNHALNHYEFIVKKMRDVMDVGPSAEMQALYKSMKKEGSENKSDKPDSDLPVTVDIETVRNIVNEIIAERLDDKKAKYSVLTLTITNKEDKTDYTDTFSSVMMRTLRKRDIYAVIDEHMVIAVLHEATDKSYEMIKKRISDCFYKLSTNNAEIKIAIIPAFSII